MTQDNNNQPREFWIETHESLKLFPPIPEHRPKPWPQVYSTNVVPNTLHVIEKAAYNALAAKLAEAERERDELSHRMTVMSRGYTAYEGHEEIYKLEKSRDEALAKAERLEDELAKTKAQLWVANDSRLRTYDGLAQKAEKADVYKAALEKSKLEWEIIAPEQHVHLVAWQMARDALKEDSNA